MSAPARTPAILVVDDSAESLEVVRRNLEGHGYVVHTAGGVPQAIDLLEQTGFDLVVTDMKMPSLTGIDLARHVRANLPDVEVVMITGYPSVDSAVSAVKAGAEEYLAKPFTEEELLAAVRRALDKLAARRAARPSPGRSSPFGLLGESAPMRRVHEVIERAAATPATVMILGESGTGKELVARAIHYAGPRAAAPFVPVNCGAIPEGLIESELFGHVRGAFTGASESRAGFFITADGGTVFLDEISEVRPLTQVKLLRVLQDKEVYMVGAQRPRKVDVRIIAATNKPLPTLVQKGAFREDLYFRLNVLVVEVPPLRERGDDVLLLASHFADKFAAEMGRKPPAFSDDVVQALRSHHWPGNVRELENLVQRVVVMLDGPVVELRDLPPSMRYTVARGAGLDRTLAEVEAEHIRNVLAHAGGNKTRAAQILGIDRKTLREKMRDRTGETDAG
jgi:two-component system, NtrC family, response regulator HydG